MEEVSRRIAVPESLALDGLVHDLARQIQGHEVERQGSEHHGADDQLVALRMCPNIPKEALFHCSTVTTSVRLDEPLSDLGQRLI
jgi:hypothetical protein